MQKISFSIYGQKLNGTIFYPEHVKEKNPAILFIHGWKSSERRIIRRAEKLTQLGFICLSFNMRGHGDSDGDRKVLTRKDYLTDVIAAYDFLLLQEGIDKEKVGIIGASFGGYLGSLLTSERNVAWLVLQAPANYPDEDFYDPKPDDPSPIFPWRAEPKSYTEVKSLQAIHDFSNEILLVESEHDDLVPKQTIENYKNAVRDKSKLKYVLLKDADHGLRGGDADDRYIQLLLDWFSAKL